MAHGTPSRVSAFAANATAKVSTSILRKASSAKILQPAANAAGMAFVLSVLEPEKLKTTNECAPLIKVSPGPYGLRTLQFPFLNASFRWLKTRPISKGLNALKYQRTRSKAKQMKP